MSIPLNSIIIKTLVDRGVLDIEKAKHLFTGKEYQEHEAIKMLIDESVLLEEDLLIVLADELNFPPIDLSRIHFKEELIRLIPERIALRHNIIPIAKVGECLTVVMSDPTDIVALDDVKAGTGCNVDIVLSTRTALKKALKANYGATEEQFTSIIKMNSEEETDWEVVSEGEDADADGIAKESSAAPIVKIVDLIITEAIKKRASDIHIEPQEKSLRVRYRVDGRLQEAFDLPKKNQNAVLARLKIMSGMDITETRIPQDGRFKVKVEGKEIDFRVSVLPLTYGNKVVMRALDRSNLSVGLDTLGFLPGPLKDFKTALSRPFGIILVTGPTGSGKSTTLYSILNELNLPERNIITVEDPVEYQLEGATQIPVNPDIGLTFASGLRSLLRQSPDVIMVGEIRDFETADIAIKASLTGQMVLTTLHTNDSVGSITRLVNMGIEPFLVSSSLIMACAQRLLRKICPYCKVEEDIPAEEIAMLAEKYPEVQKVEAFYRGAGCERCADTGYLGRMGTLETLLVDDIIRDMVIKERPEAEIREYLDKRGDKTLRDNAMQKCFKGLTTLEEVLRVT